MTTEANTTPEAPDPAIESLVSLAEGILVSRESPSRELLAKQLRLLRILGEPRNQPLPADSRKAEVEDTPPSS